MSETVFGLYIDESGDHSFGKNNIKKLAKIKEAEPAEHRNNNYPALDIEYNRYLSLTGLIIEYIYYINKFENELEALKRKYFSHKPNRPIIFHRKDIINKKGPFVVLKDPAIKSKFDSDLMEFITQTQYCVITVVIDKKSHICRYGDNAFHPYHYCLTAMLERFYGFLNFNKSRGYVIGESRGGKEDRLLKEEYIKIYKRGTRFVSAKDFQTVLTSREIKLKPKKMNVGGLQIADLLAYSLKQEILIDNEKIPESGLNMFGKKICEAVKDKYNRRFINNQVQGYGKVFLSC